MSLHPIKEAGEPTPTPRIKSFYEAMKWPYQELNGKKLLVVGAGLIGSHATVLLTRLPLVATVVDDDVVGWENIGYQMLPANSVGKGKAEALAVLAKSLGNPAIVEPKKLHVPSICSIALGDKEALRGLKELVALIGSHDVVLDALDDARYRQTVWLAAMMKGKPIVSAAYWLRKGVVVATPDPRGKSLWCTWGFIGAVERANYYADPLLVSAAASLTALTAYGILAGIVKEPVKLHLEGKGLYYDVQAVSPQLCRTPSLEDPIEAAKEMLEMSVNYGCPG